MRHRPARHHVDSHKDLLGNIRSLLHRSPLDIRHLLELLLQLDNPADRHMYADYATGLLSKGRDQVTWAQSAHTVLHEPDPLLESHLPRVAANVLIMRSDARWGPPLVAYDDRFAGALEVLLDVLRDERRCAAWRNQILRLKRQPDLISPWREHYWPLHHFVSQASFTSELNWNRSRNRGARFVLQEALSCSADIEHDTRFFMLCLDSICHNACSSRLA